MTAKADWLRYAEPIEGVERIEAWFGGKAYAMHRHDTYAIGMTLSGVQRFHYRRGRRDSVRGNIVVLHPDEAHDGQAGSEQGFGYRMVYIAPATFQDVLGGSALPFLEGGVSSDPRLVRAMAGLLQPVGHALEPLEQSLAVAELAHALAAVTGIAAPRRKGDLAAARRARDYLHANPTRQVSLDELALVSGRDRWSLSHDFRLFYGTSPYRYLTMRRLDVVRGLLLKGSPLAQAALTAGFSDQSHMTRHFLNAYGQTPGRWLQFMRQARSLALPTIVQYGRGTQA